MCVTIYNTFFPQREHKLSLYCELSNEREQKNYRLQETFRKVPLVNGVNNNNNEVSKGGFYHEK